MLKQIRGKWVLVSRKTQRPLAYYKGEGKPSDEWVQKQEKRIQYFKHMNEDVFGISNALSPMLHSGQYKKAAEELKKVLKRKTDKRHDALYYASVIAQSHPHVDARKLAKMVKEEISPDILPKSGAGQDGTDELVKTYMKATPGQSYKKFKDYIK
jgi:hypothetical protein